MRRLLATAAALLALAAGTARAEVGLVTLPAQGQEGPVTVFYPTAAPEQPVHRGPFTLSLAPDAPPARGNGRLVMISHGSGGNPWVHTDLARALVHAGFVVAAPEHHADNSRDPSDPGPDSWKLRPAEVSRAIDEVLRDPRFGAQLHPDDVGVYGMSAGGHTALVFAGGRWSPGLFARHCEAHIAEDFPACVGLITRLRGDWFDGLKEWIAVGVIRHRFGDDTAWQAHDDPRVKAVVAGVPFAADFDPTSLARPRVPLGLVTADGDRWLAPRLHSGAVLQACRPRCELVADIADGGHGALLSPPPPPAVLHGIAADLLDDPPGFDRARMAAVDQRIVAFFQRHLPP
ncbi:MAG: dienelactone hydrolase [Burkholderiales bacterium]|nr:dienelactone hydrolase [Burkholderiales bacterium]